MKMNVLRALLLPWLFLFFLIIAVIVGDGVNFHLLDKHPDYAWYLLGVGVALCLYGNFVTLSRAGIWLAHSLPSALKKSPWGWIFRALLAALIAGTFYLAGQKDWAPVLWHALVVPGVFAVCTFVIVRSLMGPILVWCSRVAFSRMSAFVLGLPIFLLVPTTAIFLGNMIFEAYQASRPEFVQVLQPPVAIAGAESVESVEEVSESVGVIPAKDPRALEFQEAVLTGKSCRDLSKDLQAALMPDLPPDVVFWAMEALKCAEMKSVVALPKLAKIMTDHSQALVRAKAIRTMLRYPREDVKRIGYLIVKRISEQEPLEVIEAAAVVLPKHGEDETKWTIKRLTALLDSDKTSEVASKVLVRNLKQEALVAEYVAAHLGESSPASRRAIRMICSLPPESRKLAEPHIGSVVAVITTGDRKDPAIHALECLGPPGFLAVRQEVLTPKLLKKSVAVRALAEMNLKSESPEAILEVAAVCARDPETEVRAWCSQTLGKIGGPALPVILDLLKSGDKNLRESGTNALNFFKDPVAKQALVKVRAENSGWMANQKKLEIAQAVDKALLKIMEEEALEQSPPPASEGVSP